MGLFKPAYRVLRKTLERFGGNGAKRPACVPAVVGPVVLSRDNHNISRANISNNALKVLYRLKDAGFQAHLVGGGVRDLLLGHEPKDFDIATDARPEQVKEVFRNCRLIGRRFRLAHVFFGREIIEVATFRGPSLTSDKETSDAGMVLSDNVYGTIEEDALRRDFTVNALYYDIRDFSVIDYAGGAEDLKAGVLRLMGDPDTRFREDPVRLLRAARFAAKLGFNIHPDTEEPMPRLAGLLAEVPAARLFEETLKLFMAGTGVEAFEKLRHYDLFGQLFPQTEEALSHQDHDFPLVLVNKGLDSTDARVRDNRPVTPAFMFAVLLWEPVRLRQEQLIADGFDRLPALQQAASQVMEEQAQRVSIPKRFSMPMREIWTLQPRFENTKGKRPQRLTSHPRFRAAYDFFLLRGESGETDPQLFDWWRKFVDGNAEARQALARQDSDGQTSSKRRRRRPRRRRKDADTGEQGPGGAD